MCDWVDEMLSSRIQVVKLLGVAVLAVAFGGGYAAATKLLPDYDWVVRAHFEGAVMELEKTLANPRSKKSLAEMRDVLALVNKRLSGTAEESRQAYKEILNKRLARIQTEREIMPSSYEAQFKIQELEREEQIIRQELQEVERE